ncbi:MAG: hypothetical protein QOH61_1661 [Chloroflexota bacterium]|jgi:hypothetical protein|nr:hypothetical protein [Chloroflexota bacterium]
MKTNGVGATGVRAMVEAITTELGDVQATGSATAMEYRRGQQVFAAIDGPRVSLRLRPDIAEAALRTPATAPSPRGADWIEFEPNPSDPQDADRLRAWLTIGWRAAQRPN